VWEQARGPAADLHVVRPTRAAAGVLWNGVPRGAAGLLEAAAAVEIRFLGPRQWAAAAVSSVTGAGVPVGVTKAAKRLGRAGLTSKCSRQAGAGRSGGPGASLRLAKQRKR